jgi:serine/threonine protein kinase
LADFDILKLLGTGGTSRVYLARDKRTGNLVALKVISKIGRNEVQLDNVIKEQTVHRLVTDPADEFILPILGSWHDEMNFFIITVRLIYLCTFKRLTLS